jgi:Na+:H+ antiporter, NhaA family
MQPDQGGRFDTRGWGAVAGALTRGRGREFAAQFSAPLRAFLRTETGGAGLLLAATVVALVWANVAGDSYGDFWSTEMALEIGRFEYREDLRHWVSDALMVFFFFVIGLELRRQLSMGELTDRGLLMVPVLGAVAGLVLPAVIYLGFNPDGEAARGWGVVMATDTAFVLGALALVGPAFPNQLRVFLLSLAVVDDIGALAAIAVFYSEDISLLALAAAAACVLGILALGRLRVWRGPAYFVVGVALWVAMVESGVHPTLGGVVLGLLISVYPPRPEEVERAGALARAFGQAPLPELARAAKLSVERAVSPNERLQELLHPWTSFFIVPVFALANAGVVVDGELVERAVDSPVTHGVVAGLVLGKLVGVGLASTLAVRLGLGRLPGRLRIVDVWGGAALAGIGFTISLFVIDLAFESQALRDEARVGVLSASVLAALLGWAIFRLERILTGDADTAPVTALDRPVDPQRDHIRGPVDAPLTLVEYGDFQCPFCGRATGVVEALSERFGDELRYVFRHLPLPDVHPDAELAAEAAEAAGSQGKFWEMHDRLFANQDRLGATDLLDHASELGLDVERFSRELGDGVHAPRVRADVESAQASGAEGTPTFFADGRRQLGRYDADALATALTAGRAPAAAASDGERRSTGPREQGLPAMGRLRSGGAAAAPLVLDGLEETPDDNGVLPRLTPAQINTLAPYGERRNLEAGEPLFGIGEPGSDFVVVLAGAVAMVDGYGQDNRVRTVHGQGRFLGELGILSGQATLLTAVAQRAGEVLIIPTERLGAALDADPSLRELVLRTYLLRRSMLLARAAELRIVGSGASPDTQRLRDFASSNDVPHSWIDLDQDQRAAQMLTELGVDRDETPVAVTRDHRVLRNPSEAELAQALGIGATGENEPRRG